MSLEGMDPAEVEALATMAKGLRDNPKTRTHFLRLAKAANPELVVPELDLEARAAAAIEKQNERLQKLQDRDTERDAQSAANALYEGLRDDRVVSSRNDFSALVKFAAEKGFQTNDAGLRMASQHRRAEAEAAEPTPSTISRGAPVPVSKELMSNPVAWARNTANEAMAELKSKRVQLG